MEQQFKIEIVPKNRLLDNVYLAPVVEPIRHAKKYARFILADALNSTKNLILGRGIDPMSGVFGGFAAAYGALFGAVNVFHSAGSVALAIGAAIGGAAVGPVVLVAGIAAVAGVVGLFAGAGRGIMKIARHHFEDKLLAAEKRAEVELKARENAVSIDTEHGIIRMIPIANVANDFAASAEVKPTEQTIRVKRGLDAHVVTTPVEGGMQVQITFKK